MNRYLLSSLGRRLSFKSTCREFSSSSGLLKPYVYSVSSNFTSSSRTKGRKELERLMSSTATATYDQSITSAFPSLVIGPDRAIEPQGSFAEAQAQVSRKAILHHIFNSSSRCLHGHGNTNIVFGPGSRSRCCTSRWFTKHKYGYCCSLLHGCGIARSFTGFET